MLGEPDYEPLQAEVKLDLRKDDEIISNSESVFENEKALRDIEEQKYKDKIEVPLEHSSTEADRQV